MENVIAAELQVKAGVKRNRDGHTRSSAPENATNSGDLVGALILFTTCTGHLEHVHSKRRTTIRCDEGRLIRHNPHVK